ncbi:MAG: tRNA (guanosine(37)-N1)-methyltransferase TrmD [Candidatus Kaiserbacteria bacterium]|nr:tRNA (guanosine(37)-N1)-methyltransferase TrmD [Candidatus Kaiserbacteria bacterium]
MLHFHIITLFPESIKPYLTSSILGRAMEDKKIKISFYDPKKFAVGKHKRVDQRPYGGGPGMVLEPNAVLRASESALKKALGKRQKAKGKIQNQKPETIFFSTDGAQFDEAMAKKLARKKNILLITGRYEGVDARVPKILKAKAVSVGPYVLTGGELPAATVIDAVARFVPGVLGKAESLERSRVSSPEVYTRPEVLVWKGKKYRVPKVLLSGHQAKINEWKQKLRK